MKIDKHFFFKVYLKLMRSISSTKNSDVPIKSGVLKGYKMSLKSSNNLFFIGNHEKEQINFILENLDSNGCFYDIGANAGYYSMAASLKLKENNSIFAFEPMPYYAELVEHNARINNINNINIYPYALSDKAGFVEFSNVTESSGNTYISNSSLFKKSEDIIKVETISIDKFIASNPEVKIPTIIKLDAEGAEYDVLVGAKNTLLKHKPLMLLSTHDRHLPGVKDKCLDFLSQIGYVYEEQDLGLKEMGLEDFIAKPSSKILA